MSSSNQVLHCNRGSNYAVALLNHCGAISPLHYTKLYQNVLKFFNVVDGTKNDLINNDNE